jgi:condensin-2 complex subunit H2
VDQWQAKLLPLLEDEGQRPEFDIHQYGIAVVREVEKSIARQSNKLDSGLSKRTNDHEVAFSDITRDCEQYDVCRMFLAALSLNNSGNIQFASSSTLESLKVNLLNSDIERPTETYILQDSR